MAVSLSTLLLLTAVCFGDGATVPETYDTIVVGAGAAGVTAGAALAREGKRVLGLEAQDRVGGRVRTVPCGDGVVEVGAEWIHGTEGSRVYLNAVEKHINLIPQDYDIDVYKSDGSTADRALYKDVMEYTLNVLDSPPEGENISLAEFLTKNITDYLEEKHPKAFENKVLVEEILSYSDLYLRALDASTSWTESSASGTYESLKGHQYMSWNTYGYKTFFDILLNKYDNGPGLPTFEIKLNTEVTQIIWPEDPTQSVTVKCKDGTSYTANNVIVTVSLGVLKASHTTLFSPALPQDKVTAIENIAMGCLGKIILVFDQPWWPYDKSTSFAYVWTKADKEKLKEEDQWLENISGTSTPMGNNNSITIWSTLAAVTDVLPDDVIREKTMQFIRRFMSANFTIPEPTEVIRSSWCINPFTRGTYSYDSMKYYQHPNARSNLQQPLKDSSGTPRVLFAGEASDVEHHSTVHGASDSGYREAMRLLNNTQ